MRPNAIIGVHGPDSVNRPGYLIARYLIEKFSWDPDAALKVEKYITHTDKIKKC